MAQQLTLLQSLRETESHVLPHRVSWMINGEIPVGHQLQTIRAEVRLAMAQVKKIQGIATEKGYEDILAILNEVVECQYN